MKQASDMSNNDQATSLLDLLPDVGSDGFGSAMLRLAHAAAALHRAEAAEEATPWAGLTTIDVSNKDKAGHGRPADARSARDCGPVTTEGDR